MTRATKTKPSAAKRATTKARTTIRRTRTAAVSAQPVAGKEMIINLLKLNCFKTSSELSLALSTKLGLQASPTKIAAHKAHLSMGHYS